MDAPLGSGRGEGLGLEWSLWQDHLEKSFRLCREGEFSHFSCKQSPIDGAQGSACPACAQRLRELDPGLGLELNRRGGEGLCRRLWGGAVGGQGHP